MDGWRVSRDFLSYFIFYFLFSGGAGRTRRIYSTVHSNLDYAPLEAREEDGEPRNRDSLFRRFVARSKTNEERRTRGPTRGKVTDAGSTSLVLFFIIIIVITIVPPLSARLWTRIRDRFETGLFSPEINTFLFSFSFHALRPSTWKRVQRIARVHIYVYIYISMYIYLYVHRICVFQRADARDWG